MVSLLVVAANLKHFRNEPETWSTLDLDDDVERVCDIRLDGAVRYLHTPLQHACSKPRNALGRRICMDRRKLTRTRLECFPRDRKKRSPYDIAMRWQQAAVWGLELTANDPDLPRRPQEGQNDILNAT